MQDDHVRQVIAVARAVVEESMDLVAGCREIMRLSRGLDDDGELAPLLNVVRMVESETDAFPIGDVRARWSPAALADADRKRSRYVDVARPVLLDAVPPSHRNTRTGVTGTWPTRPKMRDAFTHFIEIDVTVLAVLQGRRGVFVIPDEAPLDLTGRIVRSGASP